MELRNAVDDLGSNSILNVTAAVTVLTRKLLLKVENLR